MFDNISIELQTVQAETSLCRLSDVLDTDRVSRTTGEVTHTGRLDGFSVRIWPAGIWLAGSLAKFYFANNIETLSRSDTARSHRTRP